MKNISTVGVVGAGTMGSALAQKFAQEDFTVLLADREMRFVEKGLQNISNTLQEGVDAKVFTPEQRERFLSNIKGTANLNDLVACDLVVEAIFENFDAKTELFKQLDGIVKPDCILATNTSSFSVTDLARALSKPERFIGLHYFYHAAKNRLVEIIPGEATNEETFESAKAFSVQSGKDAISCKDSYGFVVNRYFVPWLNESARLLEEGVANIPTIDEVCMEVFGIGMGPFALMNATGVPVAYHSQKTLEVYGSFYKASEILRMQTEAAKPWDLDGEPSKDENTRTIIKERMLGVEFLVCSQLLDEKVCTSADINRGARIGLRWRKGPIELMKQMGEDEVGRLIKKITAHYGIDEPKSYGASFWNMQFVDLQIKGPNALITFNRPEDLNALNEEVFVQLDAQFTKADADPNVKNIYITGSGKAFVAGADIKFFIKNIKANRIEDIEKFTQYGQSVYQKIDQSSKKVVAILNGLTLGGGLELALCADLIYALPKAMMSFPETGIGIYPGLGGTQRSARKIGKGLSKYLIQTGKMLNAKDACDMGLVDGVLNITQMFDLISGKSDITESGRRAPGEKWQAYGNVFNHHSLDNIIKGEFTEPGLSTDEIAKIAKAVKSKAPIAVKLADKLIEDAMGCESELNHLRNIFTTSDALLGLSSIGKKVEFQGT